VKKGSGSGEAIAFVPSRDRQQLAIKTKKKRRRKVNKEIKLRRIFLQGHGVLEQDTWGNIQ